MKENEEKIKIDRYKERKKKKGLHFEAPVASLWSTPVIAGEARRKQNSFYLFIFFCRSCNTA